MFRVGLTRDFLRADGSQAFADIDTSILDVRGVAWACLGEGGAGEELPPAQMADLDAQFPGYGLAAHKGYGTPFHREALQRLGPTPIHRTSFAPVARAAGAGQRTLDLG